MALETRPADGKPAYVALTDATIQTLVAAPGAAKHLVVSGIYGSNAAGAASQLDWKENTTVKHSFYMAASGGGHACPFGGAGWRLPSNTALKVQQSNAGNAFASCVYRVEMD